MNRAKARHSSLLFGCRDVGTYFLFLSKLCLCLSMLEEAFPKYSIVKIANDISAGRDDDHNLCYQTSKQKEEIWRW